VTNSELFDSIDADSFYIDGSEVADTKAPNVPIERRWEDRRFQARLVNPANRRKLSVIIVGSGLAGSSAAATLGEAGYNVSCFCYQDSPRRAHSIAAQGGINAAKNYRNDGDSVYRLFYDTVKGGDFRARESNVYRLAEVSLQIIDQCVAQGVPFAREYGGLLDNRSFGGVQVSRTFYARGQTGQQLLLGAYQALERQVAAGTVTMHTRHEMLELIVVDGRARGVIIRDMVGTSRPTSRTLWYSRPAATATCSFCPPMPWGAMSPPPGGLIAKAHISRTPVSPRFTRLASR
jgi:succinate dehydrogenase / fumarate reductase flavoprotein subunit